MTETIERPELMTPDQAADYLQISKKTIYAKTMPSATEKLPFPVVRVGRLLRFRRSDLETYVANL